MFASDSLGMTTRVIKATKAALFSTHLPKEERKSLIITT
jgi:hypothetical protein